MDHDIRQISVLVVEDEPLILMVASETLKEAGFTVFEASNAGAARELMIEHNRITVLFTDIEMPGSMNGLALAHHARDGSFAKKIIVTSGRREVQPDELPRDAMFVPKPYRLGEIIEKMKSFSA